MPRVPLAQSRYGLNWLARVAFVKAALLPEVLWRRSWRLPKAGGPHF